MKRGREYNKECLRWWVPAVPTHAGRLSTGSQSGPGRSDSCRQRGTRHCLPPHHSIALHRNVIVVPTLQLIQYTEGIIGNMQGHTLASLSARQYM